MQLASRDNFCQEFDNFPTQNINVSEHKGPLTKADEHNYIAEFIHLMFASELFMT